MNQPPDERSRQIVAVLTAFLSLFSVVGLALYGLPRFYPYFVSELGWTRQQVTSGNAYSKIFVALAFGFLAGRLVDRFGPRRLMLGGIVMAGGAVIGLSYVTSLSAFYFFYAFNALGYVFGGPLPNQVLLSRWFDKARGKAMGIAYLGIGVGGTLGPLLAFALTQALGWRGALRTLGFLMIAIALPVAYFVREPSRSAVTAASSVSLQSLTQILTRPAFYFLMLGSMASIGAVGGTIQNLALYLSLDRKLPQVEIDTTLSIILAGSIVGRLTMGWLADRWAKKHVMFLIYVIVAVSIPMLVYAPTTDHSQDLRVPLRDWPRRRLHDHSAHGRRAVWRGDSRSRHGHRADRRQRVRVGRADARRVDARQRPAATRPDSSCWSPSRRSAPPPSRCFRARVSNADHSDRRGTRITDHHGTRIARISYWDGFAEFVDPKGSPRDPRPVEPERSADPRPVELEEIARSASRRTRRDLRNPRPVNPRSASLGRDRALGGT